jgi:hypothetical protein
VGLGIGNGSYSANATGQGTQLNRFQSATVGAVQQAINSGKGNPQLQQDLQAVQNAHSPEELHAAMHKLRQDAKAAGIELPHRKGKAGGKGGKGDGDDQMVTVTDPATGQTYQVPASEAASIMSGGGGGLMSGSGGAGIGGVGNQYTTAALPGANKFTGGV